MWHHLDREEFVIMVEGKGPTAETLLTQRPFQRLARLVIRSRQQKCGQDNRSLFVSQGTIWNEETLYLWLENPQRYIQGTKMDFEGLPNPQDRVDVIEYLKEATGPPVHTNERGQATGRYGNHG